jgi:hypothetical protein
MDFITPIDKVKVHSTNAPWITPRFAFLTKCTQKAFKADQGNT